MIFGIGAAVTIRVLGLILDPASRLPGWLAFVLMPLFGFIMWVALKPFRRLTTMVSPDTDPFGDAAGAVGQASDNAKRWGKRAVSTAAAAYTGGVAGAVTAEAFDDDREEAVPERAEARPTPVEPMVVGAGATSDLVLSRCSLCPLPTCRPIRRHHSPGPSPETPPSPQGPAPFEPGPSALPESSPPQPMSEEMPLPPTEPEWYDGEEVYAIYRP